jgi:hypothetical protein
VILPGFFYISFFIHSKYIQNIQALSHEVNHLKTLVRLLMSSFLSLLRGSGLPESRKFLIIFSENQLRSPLLAWILGFIPSIEIFGEWSN